MLSKKKENRMVSDSGTGTRVFSILSGSASVKGEINIEDDLRIDGKVEGDIYCGGKVVVGPEGSVKGNIKSKSVEVTGKIFGDVTASDIVVLRASAYYEGQINTKSIEIEPGANFFGNCKMEVEKKKEQGGTLPLSNGSDKGAPGLADKNGKNHT